MRSSTSESLVELTTVLGVEVAPDLLALALTHRSYAYECGGIPTNERLEFLGDAVLGLAVTDLLFLEYGDSPESDLARLRSSMVSTRALAALARTLGPGGLGVHVRLGRGEVLTGGHDKDSILADTVEAVVGAVFLDGGFAKARALVERLLGDAIRTAVQRGAGTDWKTALQEEVAARSLGQVRYEVSEAGPDHEKWFTATAVIGGRQYGNGSGRSKKVAEQMAAEFAFQQVVEEARGSGSGSGSGSDADSVRRPPARDV